MVLRVHLIEIVACTDIRAAVGSLIAVVQRRCVSALRNPAHLHACMHVRGCLHEHPLPPWDLIRAAWVCVLAARAMLSVQVGAAAWPTSRPATG